MCQRQKKGFAPLGSRSEQCRVVCGGPHRQFYRIHGVLDGACRIRGAGGRIQSRVTRAQRSSAIIGTLADWGQRNRRWQLGSCAAYERAAVERGG